jgi:hypothetical protein
MSFGAPNRWAALKAMAGLMADNEDSDLAHASDQPDPRWWLFEG